MRRWYGSSISKVVRATSSAPPNGCWSSHARSQMYAEQAVASALNLDDLRALLHPLCTLGELCVYTGAWEEATHYLQDSVTIAERLRRLDDLRDIQAVLAERELLQENRDGALSRLRPLLRTPGWQQHL